MVWARRCPRCRQLLEKEDPEEDWLCACGWNGHDDVSKVNHEGS